MGVHQQQQCGTVETGSFVLALVTLIMACTGAPKFERTPALLTTTFGRLHNLSIPPHRGLRDVRDVQHRAQNHSDIIAYLKQHISAHGGAHHHRRRNHSIRRYDTMAHHRHQPQPPPVVCFNNLAHNDRTAAAFSTGIFNRYVHVQTYST